MLLESPGPKVSRTQFVSADNPDGTADNMSCLLKLAGISRDRVLLWNIFPWQLSASGVVTPTDQNLREAVPVTLELLSLLPELKVIVLVGKKPRQDGNTLPCLSILSSRSCAARTPARCISRPNRKLPRSPCLSWGKRDSGVPERYLVSD